MSAALPVVVPVGLFLSAAALLLLASVEGGDGVVDAHALFVHEDTKVVGVVM